MTAESIPIYLTSLTEETCFAYECDEKRAKKKTENVAEIFGLQLRLYQHKLSVRVDFNRMEGSIFNVNQ